MCVCLLCLLNNVGVLEGVTAGASPKAGNTHMGFWTVRPPPKHLPTFSMSMR